MATYSEHAHYITKMAYQTDPFDNAPYTTTITYCRDKLACHCTARYKIEWIYTQSKMSGGGSLELAQETRKKEERIRNGLFFEHLFLMCTTVLMNDLGLVRCTIC